jgi:hypothetical protein
LLRGGRRARDSRIDHRPRGPGCSRGRGKTDRSRRARKSDRQFLFFRWDVAATGGVWARDRDGSLRYVQGAEARPTGRCREAAATRRRDRLRA